MIYFLLFIGQKNQQRKPTSEIIKHEGKIAEDNIPTSFYSFHFPAVTPDYRRCGSQHGLVYTCFSHKVCWYSAAGSSNQANFFSHRLVTWSGHHKTRELNHDFKKDLPLLSLLISHTWSSQCIFVSLFAYNVVYQSGTQSSVSSNCNTEC